ncbi:MAG TPA: AMP-binding protein [Planctomycetota bacterium]|nr:AMP-binding protein [Planctomycetota bacterium]
MQANRESQPLGPEESGIGFQGPRAAPLARGPDHGLLHEMFEERVADRPRAPAVAVGREATSYAGLDRYANRLARHLWGLGVRRGARVGILLPHSVDAYAAILGVLKAGAACVPIDPHVRAGHVVRVLEDSEASVLVTTTEHARRRAGFRGQVLELDARRGAIAAESPIPLQARAEPGDLCCVFYTVDASGQRKGVMVEHGGASHLVRTCARLFGIRPWDRVYQGSALSACESLLEVWLALHAGATLVPRLPETGRLARLLVRARVTVMSCTPAFLAALRHDVPPLRLLILSAGTCPRYLIDRWSRADRRLVSIYGHAETAMIATYADLLPRGPVTAGRPLPGCRVYVLDNDLRLAKYGHVGEICVGGVGIARGYLGLPAETRARFVPDPFAPRELGGARVYLTGDLGRINASGELELHGRAAWARAWPRGHGS